MIVFIGCGATKMKTACKARKMYVGNYVQHMEFYLWKK